MEARKVILIASNRDFDTYKVVEESHEVIVIHEKDDNSIGISGTFKLNKDEEETTIKAVENYLAIRAITT